MRSPSIPRIVPVKLFDLQTPVQEFCFADRFILLSSPEPDEPSVSPPFENPSYVQLILDYGWNMGYGICELGTLLSFIVDDCMLKRILQGWTEKVRHWWIRRFQHLKILFKVLKSFVRQGEGVGLQRDVVVGNASLFCLFASETKFLLTI